MSHKLKSLSLALIAVFALGAVVASSASAATAFTVDSGATITGTQIAGPITGKNTARHEFTTKAGTVKCTKATFHGTATGAEPTTQLLTPVYEGGGMITPKHCTLANIIEVEINMNSCQYTFHAGNTVGGSSDTITATVDVVNCAAGKKIEVKATGSTCVITIGEQNGLTGIELHNRTDASTGKMDVEATIDTPNIAYTTAGTCPGETVHTPPGNYNDGLYKGVATLTSSGAAGVTVH